MAAAGAMQSAIAELAQRAQRALMITASLISMTQGYPVSEIARVARSSAGILGDGCKLVARLAVVAVLSRSEQFSGTVAVPACSPLSGTLTGGAR